MYWLICFLTDRKCCNFVPQVKDTVICTSPPPITPPQKTTTIQPRNICENCVFTNISERHSDLYIPPPPPPPPITPPPPQKKTIQPRNICFSQIFLKDTVICTSPPSHHHHHNKNYTTQKYL